MTETLLPTEQMIARPMWRRYCQRRENVPPPAPADADIADAIRVLREIHVDGHASWPMIAMQIEAERVMDWAGR